MCVCVCVCVYTMILSVAAASRPWLTQNSNGKACSHHVLRYFKELKWMNQPGCCCCRWWGVCLCMCVCLGVGKGCPCALVPLFSQWQGQRRSCLWAAVAELQHQQLTGHRKRGQLNKTRHPVRSSLFSSMLRQRESFPGVTKAKKAVSFSVGHECYEGVREFLC